MTITVTALTEAEFYTKLRVLIEQLEFNSRTPYLDTSVVGGIRHATIGIGFDLVDNSVRNLVFEAMVIPTDIRATLTNIIKNPPSTTAELQAQLDAAYGQPFIMTDAQVDQVYKQTVQGKVNDAITKSGLPYSDELISLSSLQFNGLYGSGLQAALDISDPHEARAEAWYQIRYVHAVNQNEGRRYSEAAVFGLYESQSGVVSKEEAIGIYKMYTKHYSESYNGNGGMIHYDQVKNSDIGISNGDLAAMASKNSGFLGYSTKVLSLELRRAAEAIETEYLKPNNLSLGSISPLNIQVSYEGKLDLTGEDNTTRTGHTDDLLIGDANGNALEGKSGNDILLGGQGNDTYIYNSGDGFDTIVDSDGSGQIKEDNIVLDGGKQYGDGRTYQGTDANGKKHTYVFVTGNKDTGGDVIVDSNFLIRDFQGGNLGLNLTDPEVDPELNLAPDTDNDIKGDLEPLDTDLTQDGVQSETDEFGNIKLDPSKPKPDQVDSLNDSPGNDHIMSGGGDDTIVALRGGNDLVEAGDGKDGVYGYTGNDVVKAGAGDDTVYGGMDGDILLGEADRDKLYGEGGKDVLIGGTDGDILSGGAEDDKLYADTQVSVAVAIAAGNSQTGTGLKGDWLSGEQGDDTLVGSANNDVVTGGSGNDLLIGGAGDDDIIGDANWVVNDFNWKISNTTGFRDYIGASGEQFPADAGVDVVYAGKGNDYVWTGEGNDVIFGEDGNDSLNGEGGNDIILGGDGNDVLGGQQGNDVLIGGAGIDNLFGGSGNDTLDGGEGADTLDGGAGEDNYLNVGEADKVLDNIGNSTLALQGAGGLAATQAMTLSNSANLLLKLDTGETITMLSVFGGSQFTLQFGNGTILDLESHIANTFTTALNLGLGSNGGRLFGGAAGDLLWGGAGNDILDGHLGNDILRGSNGNNVLNGGEGNDMLLGKGFGSGISGNDTLNGGTGNDTLSGEEGNDILNGGTGIDTLNGGVSSDTYLFDLGWGQDTLNNFDTSIGKLDVIQFGAGITALDINVSRINENLILSMVGTTDQLTVQDYFSSDAAGAYKLEEIKFADGIVWNVDTVKAKALVGGSGNDTLYGYATADTLDGLLGNDILFGLGGNDTLNGGDNDDLLDGGTGMDTMLGGAGNDTYVVDDALDVVTETLDGGADTVESSITYTLGSNVENLVLTDVTAINGTGNELDNVLIGNSADNILNGGTGADTLIGGAGNDTYVIDDILDVVTEEFDEGADTVKSSITYTLTDNVENLTLTGMATIDGIGNRFDNVLAGNSAVNTLIGGAGNDIYVVANALDVVIEEINEGTDTVRSSVTYTLSTNVEKLSLIGTKAISGIGNDGNNTLIGNTAANTLSGRAGDDIYVIGADDTVVENANEGTDTVKSSVTYTLGANVEKLTLTGTGAINGTGNDGNNTLIGNTAANTLNGGIGNDRLVGGTGNDTYVFGRGYGIDTVVENDATVGDTDIAQFLSGVITDQLWFRHVGNNLQVSIIGTSDKMNISNWYTDEANRIKQFVTADGRQLLDTQVENLVSAMASFSPPAAGQTTLPQNYQDALAPVLAANWQ
jgi:Ca2+-binding RTX toxin-like protein